MVRRQRWCDLQLIVDDLVDRGVLRMVGPVDDDIDEWGW